MSQFKYFIAHAIAAISVTLAGLAVGLVVHGLICGCAR
jgi:hypothetical protein